MHASTSPTSTRSRAARTSRSPPRTTGDWTSARARTTLPPMSIRINRVYTKVGDRGETALVGGKMVPKDSPRIEAYGTVDELNACIGLARQANREETGPETARARIDGLLDRVQNELFNLGSTLATLP